MKLRNHSPIKSNGAGSDRVMCKLTCIPCFVIALTVTNLESAVAEDSFTDGKSRDSISIQVDGILRLGQMAIGGETTGTTITSKGIEFDVDWSDAERLGRKAEPFDGKHVRLSGQLRQQTGPERGRRFVIDADSVGKSPAGDQRPIDFRLESLRWKKRPLMIFSPTQSSATLQSLLDQLNRFRPQIRDREMAILKIVGDDQATLDGRPITPESAERLRTKFKISDQEFAVILVGKDGTEKFRSQRVVNLPQLFELIDSMPMRQREIRRRR